MSVRPLVSIIVPSYNQGRYLRETLDSIFAQDYRPLEVLVLDGASTDDSVAILEEYAQREPDLRWWSEADSGVAEAVNKGLARARGVFAGIQSSDDVYRPGAIGEALEIFARDPDAGVICGSVDVVGESGVLRFSLVNRAPFTLERFLARTVVIHQSSTFFRLDLARALGGWKREYFCCDTELWLRMALAGTTFRCSERTWSAWRTHAGQRDKESGKMRESWARMLADSRELRRAPLALRLAARAGRHVLATDYCAGRPAWHRAGHAWLALLLWPPSLAGIYHPRRVLLPWLVTLKAALQRRRPQRT